MEVWPNRGCSLVGLPCLITDRNKKKQKKHKKTGNGNLCNLSSLKPFHSLFEKKNNTPQRKQPVAYVWVSENWPYGSVIT